MGNSGSPKGQCAKCNRCQISGNYYACEYEDVSGAPSYSYSGDCQSFDKGKPKKGSYAGHMFGLNETNDSGKGSIVDRMKSAAGTARGLATMKDSGSYSILIVIIFIIIGAIVLLGGPTFSYLYYISGKHFGNTRALVKILVSCLVGIGIGLACIIPFVKSRKWIGLPIFAVYSIVGYVLFFANHLIGELFS